MFDYGTFVHINGQIFFIRDNGGEGSGNFGHAGIPGQIGGSSSGGGGSGESTQYGRHINNPKTIEQAKTNLQAARNDIVSYRSTRDYWFGAGIDLPPGLDIDPDLAKKFPNVGDLKESVYTINNEIDYAGDDILDTIGTRDSYDDEDEYFSAIEEKVDDLNYWLNVGDMATHDNFKSALKLKDSFDEQTTTKNTSHRKTRTHEAKQ